MRHPDACFIAFYNALIIGKSEEGTQRDRSRGVPIMQIEA